MMRLLFRIRVAKGGGEDVKKTFTALVVQENSPIFAADLLSRYNVSLN